MSDYYLLDRRENMECKLNLADILFIRALAPITFLCYGVFAATLAVVALYTLHIDPLTLPDYAPIVIMGCAYALEMVLWLRGKSIHMAVYYGVLERVYRNRMSECPKDHDGKYVRAWWAEC